MQAETNTPRVGLASAGATARSKSSIVESATAGVIPHGGRQGPRPGVSLPGRDDPPGRPETAPPDPPDRAREGVPPATTVPYPQVAIFALLCYVAVRILLVGHDQLGIGLAAIPLFFAGAFLRPRSALAVSVATVAAALIPSFATPHLWGLADVETVVEVSVLATAAVALRQARYRARVSIVVQESQETNLVERLDAVLAIARKLTATFDRADIFRTIVTEMNRTLEADGTTIRIIEGDRAVVSASAGIPDDVVARLPVFRSDEGWMGEVFRTRRPIVRSEVPETGTQRPWDDIYDGVLERRAELIVPLVLDDEVIGALATYSSNPRTWTTADVEFAVAVATQAAIAIHNADLFARTESWANQLGVLQAASARMSRQNSVQSVGRAIVEEVARIIDYHNCRVYLIAEPDDLVPIAYEGRIGAYERLDLAPLGAKIGQGFTGWVAEHGTPLLIHDANADPRGQTIPGTEDVDESMLCVPMRYDERVIGVITLSKLGFNQFDEGDLRLLSILADQAATAVESAGLLARSDRLARELRRLLDMSSALSRSLDPNEVAVLIARHLVDALDVDQCVISWWEQASRRVVTLGYWPRDSPLEIDPSFELDRFPLTEKVLAAQIVAIVDVDDPDADPAEVAYLREQGDMTCAMLPLVSKDRSIALVELTSRTRVVFDDAALELARTMANEAAMALENARHYEDARKLADRDQLTGFFNHRFLHQRLGEEIVRAKRSHTPLGLLMIDLDDFKLVNDTFGHLFGDRVLAWAAEQIRSALRASDVPARYGGDEFAIILPDTDGSAARRAAERILEAFRAHAYQSEDRGTVPVGASIGIASYPADGRTGRDLIAVADADMYRIKEQVNGRPAAGPRETA